MAPAEVHDARPARPGGCSATIATANDVHFGEVECGRIGDLREEELGPILRSEPGEPPYPEVMNGAVIDEMVALDPDAVVVKGDLTNVGDGGGAPGVPRRVRRGSGSGCTGSGGTTTP